MYAEFTQPQLSFLALVPCVFVGLPVHNLLNIHVPMAKTGYWVRQALE